MTNQPIELTAIDRDILNSYASMVNGLACYLGKGYEIVLHSLESFENSVINIINGEYTGRKIGSPITDLALSMLEKAANDDEDQITYFSTNKKGEPMKSTTIAIHGENNRIIGLLCINLYLNIPLSDILEGLTPINQPILSQASSENFVENTDELIESTLNSIRERVLSDDTIIPSNKNKTIVNMLDDYGIFHFKDAVIKVSSLMGISKNTVYMHIRNKQRDRQA